MIIIETYLLFKKNTFRIIEKAEKNDISSKIFDFFIITLILLNTLSIILESFDSIISKYAVLFNWFEIFSILIFTLEYILRFWTADLRYEKEMSRFKVSIKFVFSFMPLIDLFAILPFYLPMLIPCDLRILRLLRLTRLSRIFKMNRYSKAMNLIFKVIKDKKEELLATIFIMCFLILISATLIYYLETNVQNEAFPNIVSAFWWAVATLTTVGYGDVYPITGLGKLLASLIAILGIGLVALPTGIISSAFMEELNTKKDVKVIICPCCGEKITKKHVS